tara:strand:- start:102 stop:344 length:243 start_codon:yes stop_codon:yes gene_type:complete
MWENWDKLLHEIVVIKWAVVSMAASLCGVMVYYLLKEIPKWWDSFNKKKKKPFTLEQMKKDLAGAERPATRYPKRKDWDG